MSFWLMKSEPSECGIDDLAAAPAQTVPWVGVRNYQARNFMRDDMHVGDGVLFYHSSCAVPGIAGIAEVASTAYPDATQFDPASHYHDPSASRADPRWLHVDVRLVRKTPLLALSQIRATPSLASLRILQRGNRLSITPVTPAEWKAVLAVLKTIKARDRSGLVGPSQAPVQAAPSSKRMLASATWLPPRFLAS